MKGKNAGQLIYEYQLQESIVESSEEAIKSAKIKKREIFEEITSRHALMEALETTGVTNGTNVYRVEGINSGLIDISPAPVGDYTLNDEPVEGAF